MNRIPPELRQTLNTVKTFPKLQEQQKTLDRAAKSMDDLSPIFSVFREVRIEQNSSYPANYEELMSECRRYLLCTAPVKSRKSIRDNATRYADSLFPNDCDFSKMAKAEVSLRKIFLLCLRAAAIKYKARVRLLDWNTMIASGQANLNQIESEWRETISLNL